MILQHKNTLESIRVGFFSLVFLATASIAFAGGKDAASADPKAGSASQSASSSWKKTSAPVIAVNGSQALAVDDGKSFGDKLQELLVIGPVEIHPHFEAAGSYDDNLRISRNNKITDYIVDISPGVFFGVGEYGAKTSNYFTLDYTPTIFQYIDHSEFDNVDHAAHSVLSVTFQKLTIALDADYKRLSGGDFQLGDRVKRDQFTTNLGLKYELTEKIYTEADLSLSRRDYDPSNYSDNTQYDGEIFIGYKFSPKLKFAAGGGGGKNEPERSSSATFARGSIKANWQATEKISTELYGGIEERYYANNLTRTSPRLRLGIGYTPFDSTQISLSGGIYDSNSSTDVGSDIHSSSVGISFRQRFVQKVFFTLSGGFQNDDYSTTSKLIATNRNDDYYYIVPGLEYQFNRYFNANIRYTYRESDTNVTGGGFDNNIFRLSIGARF